MEKKQGEEKYSKRACFCKVLLANRRVLLYNIW